VSVRHLKARVFTSAVPPPPIDLANEQVVTFTELARRLPRRRNGRPTHVSTIHRWRQRGLSGVRLAAARCGAIWVTTWEAYQRFVDALTAVASNDSGVGATPPTAADDRTDQALDALGI
jgi:hypothetical protein